MTSEKNYTIKTPYFKVHEAGLQTKSLEQMQEEKYFVDVYHLFLSRLTKFANEAETSDLEYNKLVAIFKQMISQRRKLEGKDEIANL